MTKVLLDFAKLFNEPETKDKLAEKIFSKLTEINENITCLALLVKNENAQELWIESKGALKENKKEEVIVHTLFAAADRSISRDNLKIHYRAKEETQINLGTPLAFPLSSNLATYSGALVIWGEDSQFITEFTSVFETLANMLALKLAFLHQIASSSAFISNLGSLAQPIFSSPALHIILKNILLITSKNMNSEYVTLRLLDESGNFLILKECLGFSDEFKKAKAIIKIGESIAGLVVKEKRCIEIPNIKEDTRYNSPELTGDAKALIMHPLLVKDEIIGVLGVYYPAPHTFTENERIFLGIISNYAAVAITIARLYEREKERQVAIVKALTCAIEAKDPYTRRHSENVANYTLAIADALGFSKEDREWLYLAALLHDIGKIGIKDEVLHKKEKLTEKEFEIIKGHPIIGVKILESIGFPGDILLAIRWHHERVDGKGYPDALPKEKLSLAARIIKVADAFEAMISERPYRPALPINEAIKELQRGTDIHFDPDVVECLINILRKEGKIVE